MISPIHTPALGIALGDVVEVTPTSRYYDDFRDATFNVIGLQIKRGGRIDVTIADGPPGGRWSCSADGFSPEELRRVDTAAAAGGPGTTDRIAYAFAMLNRFDDRGWGYDQDGEELGDCGLPGAGLFGRALAFWVHCQEAVGLKPTVDDAAAAFHCPPDLIRQLFSDEDTAPMFLCLFGDQLESDGA